MISRSMTVTVGTREYVLGTKMVDDWLEKQTASPCGLLEAQICMNQKQQDVQKEIW